MYYFSEKNYRGNHAGTKARNDVESILMQLNAKAINSKTLILKTDASQKDINSNIQSRFDYIRFFADAKRVKNQVVFIQYPMLTFDMIEKYIRVLAKKNKIVFLIHDIHGLRRQDEIAIKKEVEILNLGYAVILHNRFMEKELKKWGLLCSHIYCLDIFDYLCKKMREKEEKESSDIVFAGNLEKSKFLEEFIRENSRLSIWLFGIGWDEMWRKYKNVRYAGNFPPDEIPFRLNGKYGLVWDGDDIKCGSGEWGMYTKINNPHKLSLYVASGIPVIAWKEAAVAEYIEKNQIGITVESLENIECVINQVSMTEYDMFCKNIKKIRKEIVDGLRLRNILNDIEKI